MASSPLMVGLPNGLRPGDSSNPFTEADLLVGGEVPKPWDETGDRTGEGDLLMAEDSELSPAM